MTIGVQDLYKRYDGVAALDGISFGAENVHTLVLIGPSGGGKSTLLRVLGGLEQADEGRVEVNGRVLGHDPSGLLVYRRQNGFLFQQFNLFPHLTAERNISLPLEIVHKRGAGEAADIAAECLNRFGLTGHAHKLPAQLSGGQQQRVGIARAVAVRPEVLFLDEPTSALDPEMTAEVLELIQELAEAGQDIILSTHEMGFARAVADRVAFVAAGRVAEIGRASEVFSQPQSAGCQKFLSRVMRY
ncbi:MAG: amino acid ABC transporter ATP-binding protein [Verrucomicrobiales bacterium]